MNLRSFPGQRTAAFLMLLIGLLASLPGQTAPQQPWGTQVVDLAMLANGQELLSYMEVRKATHTGENLEEGLNGKPWQKATSNALKAPRQHSVYWLRATFQNSSQRALTQWLVFEPWRLNRLDAYVFSERGELIWKDSTGLEIPQQERSVDNGKTAIPVAMAPGEQQRLLIRVYSDSLPFLSIRNQNPVAYTRQLDANESRHIAFLAGITILLFVLALQLNKTLLITGVWLLVAFIFESEKDGFFSTFLLPGLSDYSANLRVSAWFFTEYLFLVTSVLLLKLPLSRAWRGYLIVAGSATVLMSLLTFVLDGAQIRNLGVIMTAGFAISWLLLVPKALSNPQKGQKVVLSLLATYWAVSAFLLAGYTFNFYYTSAFAAARIYAESAIALALIATYTWQQKHQVAKAQQAVKSQRQRLEMSVKDRTRSLDRALNTAKKENRAKVDFLAQITHDLRAPLSTIIGYTRLRKSTPDAVPMADQVIEDRATYMLTLIDGLVNYARDIAPSQDEVRDIYLTTLIDSLVYQGHILANRNQNIFQLDIETEIPTLIRSNSTQLQRILLNLIENAAKYTQNGSIVLSVAMNVIPGNTPSIVFRVIDTGCGISEEDLKKIYVPFFMTSDSNPGAGLGLPIAFELAKSLGGQLELDSQPGEGTTATCTLPCDLNETREQL
ncbi:hypothetical protein KUV44_04360 [Marinobacter daepoensis]|uniref:histidine kinase n=1 Tax=Marinobacter daepoensis TaxID=262077 RepID=A0ABS3BFM1_9GAMM|nr:ATP-binding protein [Marinobacter daepoensis]MBN7769671.1 hypothetical protein [Marinobacter daepoensis]MBY6031669.1 hypothetical protein [Marinobacter daepoensis]MBY6078361.1 hypothetical protein [Marinobacter daepoensis]